MPSDIPTLGLYALVNTNICSNGFVNLVKIDLLNGIKLIMSKNIINKTQRINPVKIEEIIIIIS